MGASASASLLNDTHTDTQTHTSEYFTNKPVKGRGGGNLQELMLTQKMFLKRLSKERSDMQTDTDRHRQTDRQTDTDRHRQTDRQIYTDPRTRK